MKLLTLIALWIYVLFPSIARSESTELSTTLQLIQTEQQNIRADRNDVAAVKRLSSLYIQMTRSTADMSFVKKAEQLLNSALQIQPQNYDLRNNLGLVLMAQHRFLEARDIAAQSVQLNPGESTAYGVFGDASFELGDYDTCAKAYQKMLDLHPGSPAYGRIAYYRRLTGDIAGANKLLLTALNLTDIHDNENRAWFLYQMGLNFFLEGKLQEASECEKAALTIFPGYYNALAAMGKILTAEKKFPEAISYYQQAVAVVPMPEFVASLGDLYSLSGNAKEAEKQYAFVEYIGRISQINQEIYNRQLALFYADHNRNLTLALNLTAKELSVRKDIYGYDAYAWCLYRNYKYSEAADAMKKAVSMNTMDPLLLFHAGMISLANGATESGMSFLKRAVQLNPQFHPIFASVARKELDQRNS